MFRNVYTTGMSDNMKSLTNRFEMINAKPIKFGKIIAAICCMVLVATLILSVLVTAKIAENEEEYILEVTNNGIVVELENKAFVNEGIVYVPLRELFTKIGLMQTDSAKMEWNDGIIMITLCHENLNEDATFKYESYLYKIEIGNSEFVINPDELVTMSRNYEFFEEMKGAPILKGNITYVPFSFAERLVERADNGVQSPKDRYNLNISYSGEIFTIAYPFDSYRDVTVPFGKRVHPITGEEKLHSGIDIKAEAGTPVYAGIQGEFEVFFDDEKGACMSIFGENGVEITYCHLDSEILNKLWRAMWINKGTVLGYVGNTGQSTGAHLHMEIKINGEYTDPEMYFERTDEWFLVSVIKREMPRQLERNKLTEYNYIIKEIIWKDENKAADVVIELSYDEDVKTMTTTYFKSGDTDIWNWREAVIN